jgi:hypothetical protein
MFYNEDLGLLSFGNCLAYFHEINTLIMKETTKPFLLQTLKDFQI